MMGCSVYRYLSLHCADLTATVRPGWGPARPSRAAAPTTPKVVGANRNPNGQPLTAEGTYEAQSPLPSGGARMSAGATTRGPATVPDQGLR